MEKLRVGVIGLGIGRHHISGYQGHPQAEVVAVSDINEKLLDEMGEKYNISKRYLSAEEMLSSEKLDVVSVVTPNKYHRDLTLAAFQAGCHVLCEKPMAMNAEEGREMLEAAKTAGKRLMINFSYRFTEQSMALKAQVESGILGDVYFTRTVWHRRRGLPGIGGWFGRKELSGGGPLIDLGVHRLDLALWLMNYPQPTWKMGNAYNYLASEIAAKQEKGFDVVDLAAGAVFHDPSHAHFIQVSLHGNPLHPTNQGFHRLPKAVGEKVHRTCEVGGFFFSRHLPKHDQISLFCPERPGHRI